MAPRRNTLLLTAGIVLLLSLALIATGRLASSLRGDRQGAGAGGSPVSTPVDFFSQEFSASADDGSARGIAAGGLADALLKASVWNSLRDYERGQGCSQVASQAVSLAEINEEGAFWIEDWTVRACGRTQVFKVRFAPDQVGGTLYSIAP
ncbi:MAG TPA: hypothetical protein VLZ89_11465 [Anaerolineales bacterium]|nr:hypothetical protein [Anaerolineales bacterium]